MFKYVTLFSYSHSSLRAPTPVAHTTYSDVTVVFVHSTFKAEPIRTIVGPQFKAVLQVVLPGKFLNFIGVEYPADLTGFEAGGSSADSKFLAADVTAQASACPNTKIIISRYRCALKHPIMKKISYQTFVFIQGAQLVYKGSALLSTTVQSHVNAVVMFGALNKGQTLPGVLNRGPLIICAIGDIICLGGQIITAAHLGYKADTAQAVSFVVSHI
ncbi:carbohydrate esterase family 5 protein [Sphaerobolus stellatus SS14]|uniref:cutinase n=1 Tax=Sphaerobolus stellatus (strain SS14) TaxID=990650 RepID=A0A0C9VTK5_SPHS4|nr:carbohydrate esterase family 5 protein [Sphaerobolus stellatus SS14]